VSWPTVTVEVADVATDELVTAINHLIPQLSSSFSGLDHAGLSAICEDPAVMLLVARSPELGVVGTLTLATFTIPTGIRAWIEDVVVDESARGLGAAKALVRRALELADQAGASTVDLTSRPSREAANQLYLTMGFEERTTNVYRFTLGG
jgi:ribosomal protein S18 acetylase RimI-like enzyme